MRRNKLASMAIAALAVTAFAACGDDDDDPAEDPTGDTTMDSTMDSTMDT
ncbi:MAG: hypothetical protein M3487_08985 [Actinomycetota bacterium]|nr:hypothetical protein [Actinomycetota bacterium]